MATFYLTVLTPDRMFYSGECESLIFPASDGAFGVKANHSPFVSLVEPGSLKLRKPNGEEILAAVSQGIVRFENDSAMVIVASAETAEEIDEDRARRDIEASEMHMKNRKTLLEYRLAKLGLARATTRLNVRTKATGNASRDK